MRKVTEWFPPKIQPVHTGWYQAKFTPRALLIVLCWWDNGLWRIGPGCSKSYVQHRYWRGLTKLEGKQR